MNKRKNQTIEATLEEDLVKKIENLGGICWKLAAKSNTGVPDRVIVWNGEIIFIEMKRPAGSASIIQKFQHKRLLEAGADVRIIKSKEEVETFVHDLVKKAEITP